MIDKRANLLRKINGKINTLDEDEFLGFCQTFYETVYNNKMMGMTRGQITRLLIDHTEKKGELDLLINRLNSEYDFTANKELAKQLRSIFGRPLFQTPCCTEMFIQDFIEAIDDIQLAINTGKLYSRHRGLLKVMIPLNSVQSHEFRPIVDKITKKLSQLKLMVYQFQEDFINAHPNYSHHLNFYSMFGTLRRVASKSVVLEFISQMDGIDKKRNEILELVNNLLLMFDISPFRHITLSSEIIKKGNFSQYS